MRIPSRSNEAKGLNCDNNSKEPNNHKYISNDIGQPLSRRHRLGAEGKQNAFLEVNDLADQEENESKRERDEAGGTESRGVANCFGKRNGYNQPHDEGRIQYDGVR